MTIRQLNAILRRHQIHPKFWPEFRGMVQEGLLPGKELWTRMNHVANFRAARDEIALKKSERYAREFPPDDYQPPADYQFYESLNPEDIAQATSGGCAV
jgi:hypothetical protein